MDDLKNITITDGALDDLKAEIMEVAKRNPKVKQNMDRILRSIDLVKNFISKNDARNAVFAARFMDYLLFESGHFKPFYLERASMKGGAAPKRDDGFFLAIEYAWEHSKRKTALYLWKFLIEACARDMFVAKTAIDLIYEKRENKLYHYRPDGTSRKIGFRAFQKYLADFKKKSQ